MRFTFSAPRREPTERLLWIEKASFGRVEIQEDCQGDKPSFRRMSQRVLALAAINVYTGFIKEYPKQTFSATF